MAARRDRLLSHFEGMIRLFWRQSPLPQVTGFAPRWFKKIAKAMGRDPFTKIQSFFRPAIAQANYSGYRTDLPSIPKAKPPSKPNAKHCVRHHTPTLKLNFTCRFLLKVCYPKTVRIGVSLCQSD